MPVASSVPQYYVLVSAATGGLVGALGAVSAQLVAHFLTRRRDENRFRIESFERLRREYDADEELRRISQKNDPLTDRETERILGFFEEVGLYWERNLIDRDLDGESSMRSLEIRFRKSGRKTKKKSATRWCSAIAGTGSSVCGPHLMAAEIRISSSIPA